MGVNRPRAREFGIAPGLLRPGALNAITDVPGVKVGHVTLVSGEGPLVPGRGPVRTGVTAVLPHGGNLFRQKVRAYIHVINGFGKAAGIAQVRELGVMETPIVLTNTLSVGTAWDALCGYMLAQNPEIGVSTSTVNPVVAECNDGFLNDIRGRHVKTGHVLEALETAKSGPVEEGNAGAGTGMSCFGFKGGIGTSSRRLAGSLDAKHLGVLVLSNFGNVEDLLVGGVPVGPLMADPQEPPAPPGSIVVVVATDAPVTDRQLGRIARRCQGGLARTGSVFGNGSGDFVIAFTTANSVPHEFDDAVGETAATAGDPAGAASACAPQEPFLSDSSAEMASLFRAAVETTEEAVLNALFAAETMVGRDGQFRRGLPLDELEEVLLQHRALAFRAKLPMRQDIL